MLEKTIAQLEDKSRKIRRHVLTMIAEAGSGHTGGSLSSVDIITALYFYKMKYDAKKPSWEDRDRFILSKGHAAPALYAALAEAGFFPHSEFKNLRKVGGMLQGHPSMTKTPGVEASTGSLGQGLSFANGVALAGKMDGRKYRVYVLMGDGECDEGQVWEAAMTAAHYKLDNLTAIIDHNGFQIDGPVDRIMGLGKFSEKWESFGWRVLRIDGHKYREIMLALDEVEQIKDTPTMIMAQTIKGKGVSFLENNNEYHGKPISAEQLQKALKELE